MKNNLSKLPIVVLLAMATFSATGLLMLINVVRGVIVADIMMIIFVVCLACILGYSMFFKKYSQKVQTEANDIAIKFNKYIPVLIFYILIVVFSIFSLI